MTPYKHKQFILNASNSKTCYTFNNGKWTSTGHKLQKNYGLNALAWNSPDGIMLYGSGSSPTGEGGSKQAELLSKDSSGSTKIFDLPYKIE